jgi:type VI secretion system protein ImpH
MAPEERQQDPPLKDRLFEEFYRFSFFQAVTLLELLAPEKTPIGRALSPGQEAARFSVKPGLAFAPSDISALRRGAGDGPAEMEVAFMGFIGPSGVLPHWYNELAIERTQQKDDSLSAFFDIFHHRLLSLFYLAWKKHRFPVSYLPGGTDRLSGYLLSLIGLGTEGLGRMGLRRESLISYGGLLSRQVPSAVAIEAAVGYFSGVEARLDQFVDRVIPLEAEDRSCIGEVNGKPGVNAELGVNAVCGSEVRENQTMFRVNLGPVDYGCFLRFLPTGDMLRPLCSLIRYMAGIEFDFEVRLYLKRKEVIPCRLGRDETPDSPRLGWSTWFKAPGEAYPEDPYITFGNCC